MGQQFSWLKVFIFVKGTTVIHGEESYLYSKAAGREERELLEKRFWIHLKFFENQ